MFEYSDDINKEVQKIMKLITLHHGKIEYYGTYANAMKKISKYPCDIDCKQFILVRDFSYNQMDRIAKQIQELFKKINEIDYLYFQHYILGIDYRFYIHYIINNGKIEEYNPNYYRNKFKKLFDEKIINEEEYNKFFSLIKDEPSLIEITNLMTHAKKYYIIKWSINEIIAGEKKLRGDKVVTFTNLLRLRKNYHVYSITAKIDKYYINFELAFRICMKNKHNELECLIDRKEHEHFYESLIRNIVIKKHYFKALKRLRSSLGNLIFKTNIDKEQKRKIHNVRQDIIKIYNQDIGKKTQCLSLLKTLQELKSKISEEEYKNSSLVLFNGLNNHKLYKVDIQSDFNPYNLVNLVIKNLSEDINVEAKKHLRKYLKVYATFTNFYFEI